MKLDAETVAGFSASLLQKNYDNAVESPVCHMEWWELCCSDHPNVAIAAPRRHAKSTAITGAYVLASVLFRARSYVLIISDTITQATLFLNEIKDQLYNNDSLRGLFKIKPGDLYKDTEEDIIVEFQDGAQFRITAKGSEQKMRGLKWNNKRPDLIIGDDLENDEIVMNKERREKFKRWFNAAVINCLSTKGVIRVVGTILHEDSWLNNLMPKFYAKTTVHTPLKVYSTDKKSSWLSVKYKAHNEDFSQILWPQNYTKEKLLSIRQMQVDQGTPDLYSQEWLNEPIDESLAFFKRSDFMTMTQEEKKRRVNTYIAADLAISKEETADYSVFIVAGMDENRNIMVQNVIRERLDGREIVDTILSLQEVYKPDVFGIEEMQVSKSIGPFLYEEMHATGIYPNVVLLKHKGKDKIARARAVQARMRAHGIKFDKAAPWYIEFEDELCKFPRSKHDDQVDAFAYLGMMLNNLQEAATDEEINEEDYLDELRNSGRFYDGRSRTTGY